MVFDAVARHKSGPVLGVKSFRKAIKAQQVTAVPAGKKAVKSAGPEGRFPTLKEAERLHIEEALGRMVAWDLAADALAAGFAEMLNLQLEAGVLTSEERAWTAELRAEKYATTEGTNQV